MDQEFESTSEFSPVQPRSISYRIEQPGQLWEMVRDGTNRLKSQSSGYVKVGPEMGNLGQAPKMLFVNGNLRLNLDLAKWGGYAFSGTLPSESLEAQLAKHLPEAHFTVDGVNIFQQAADGEMNRIAYKSSADNHIYIDFDRIGNEAQFAAALDVSAKLYAAIATACYEQMWKDQGGDPAKSAPVLPNDTFIIGPNQLKIAEVIGDYTGKSNERAIDGLLVTEKPNVRFEDIGGQEEAVRKCRELADQLQFPEVFALQGSKPTRGILLHGPSGTGKTLLAKAIASQANAHFVSIDSSDIAGEGLVGQAEKAVKSMFDAARRLAETDNRQVIIFVDEADLLLPGSQGLTGTQRHETTAKIVGLFATEMDGMKTSGKLSVILASNDPKNIDPKIISRMEEPIEVPKPSAEGLEDILSKHLTALLGNAHGLGFAEDVSLSDIASEAYRQALSGRDIADCVSILARRRGSAQLNKIKEAIQSGSITVPDGIDSTEYIRDLARRISQGEESQLLLPPISQNDILSIVSNAKTLLPSEKKTKIGVGFVGSSQRRES